jgi:hypothetical protein
MEDFIELLLKNLKKNHFPTKKVSFDLDTLYERADHRKISLNKVLDEMKVRGIDHVKTREKIIFLSVDQKQSNTETTVNHEQDHVEPDFLAQAQAMMKNMSEEDLNATQSLVQEKFKSMSEEEKTQLFDQIKKMGLM